jgi:hypothetical protein
VIPYILLLFVDTTASFIHCLRTLLMCATGHSFKIHSFFQNDISTNVPPLLALSLAFTPFSLFASEMTFRLFLLFLLLEDFSLRPFFALRLQLSQVDKQAAATLSLLQYFVFLLSVLLFRFVNHAQS